MPELRRRAFLSSLAAAAAAPAILRAQPGSPKRLPIAFSTLGCPVWSWKAILEAASKHGYSGIELRGVAGEMDLPKVPEFQGSRLAEAKKDLAALGLVVTDLGASSRMHEKEKAARDKQLDEGRSYASMIEQDVKARLGSAAVLASAPVVARAACACGTINDEDAVFCKKCGARVHA